MTSAEFTLWYSSQVDVLYRFARVVCGDHQLAEDAVQETYYRVVKALGTNCKFTSENDANRYTFATLRNYLKSHWRHQQVCDEYVATKKLQPQPSPPNPAFEAQLRETAAEIAKRAVKEMSDAEQAALEMKIAGIERAQAASDLGCSKRQYSMRLNHAMNKLKAVCNQYAEESFLEWKWIQFLDILLLELKNNRH